MKTKILSLGVILATGFLLFAYGQKADAQKIALVDQDENGSLTSVECHPKMSLIKITGTGTPGRQINVYPDNPRTGSSPYLIQCGQATDIFDKEYKKIGQNEVGTDGKFECYLATTDYNNVVLAGHKLYVYTYDPKTYYAYKLQGNLQGKEAPKCAKWSTNFVCAKLNSDNNLETLEHDLVIKCDGKEVYSKNNRTGNMNEQILMTENADCEATCKSNDSSVKMYGYSLTQNLGNPTNTEIKKSSNEKITFKYDKSMAVIRWFFKGDEVEKCVKENESLGAVVPNNTKECCSGLVPYIEPDTNGQIPTGTRGICVKPDSANSFKLTMGIVESTDEAKDIIRLRMGGKATVDCEGIKQNIDFVNGTAENITIAGAGKNCAFKLDSFNNTSHYDFYGYTQSKNLKIDEIDPYHKKETIQKKNTVELKPTKDDLIQIRWYLKRKGTGVDCIKENKTIKSDEICCENLVEKDGKCVTKEVANKMKVKFLGGAYDVTKTTKTISKNIVSMNLECDGNTTELTKTSGSKKLTEYGNFTFNINMPTTAKCTLNNTSENKDYKFKGYTICQNKDIPNCHKNQKINSDESIDLTEYDLKNNDKLQIRWYYEKVDTGNDDGGTDNGTDNVSTSRVNRLIELLEKLLKKMGIN